MVQKQELTITSKKALRYIQQKHFCQKFPICNMQQNITLDKQFDYQTSWTSKTNAVSINMILKNIIKGVLSYIYKL